MQSDNEDGSGSHHCGGGLGVVLPFVRQTLSTLVVTRQSVDPGLDQNESVLGRLILTAFFHMSADVDGLLDHTVNIFWDLWSAS